MKAITLHQPWASLVAEGIKTIETRSWCPPRALIGERLAIHAGRTVVKDCGPSQAAIARFYGQEWLRTVPVGAVVAVAAVIGAYRVDRRDHDRAYCGEQTIPIDPHGDFSPGRWLWVLEDIQQVTPPVLARGMPGIWDWQ